MLSGLHGKIEILRQTGVVRQQGLRMTAPDSVLTDERGSRCRANVPNMPR